MVPAFFMSDGGSSCKSGESTCEMSMSTVTWEAATAAHKQRNQIRRGITAFEMRPQTRERNRQCASVHGCPGGGNPTSKRHLFVVGSLDKHIQNEKEFILASAEIGGGLCLYGEY